MSVTTLATQASFEREIPLSGFAPDEPQLDWRIVNDNVMGGRSDGEFRVHNDTLMFTGRTNTNGGGFSSIRAEPLQLDLGDFDGIRVRLKGDGRRYTWRLASQRRWRGIGVGYWAEFDTVADEWITVDLPFSDFVPQVRGRRLQGPGIDRANIAGMGLMIYDGKDGAFALELEGVYAFAKAALLLADLRWKHRVLVLSAPSPEDRSLSTQLDLITATRAQFDERDLVLLVVHDQDASAEAVALREQLDLKLGAFSMFLVGKDGGVKSAYAQPANMQEIYGLIDTMPMRQREMDKQKSE
ncbi:MAG: CIA30 family protein [Gammaproteobacteria bacterium]